MTDLTIVHVMRHGEVYNPDGILYGRRPGYHLSRLGTQMARRVAEYVADRDVVHVAASPLERAQETALPIAAIHDLAVATDDRLIESRTSSRVKRSVSATEHYANPRHGSIYGTRSSLRAESRTSTWPLGCAQRSRRGGMPRVATRPCSFLTCCRSGWPGSPPRVDRSCTTHANANAPWPRSRRSTSRTTA